MGDVGSQFCGFMLAILAVVAGRIEGVPLSFMLVPMVLAGVLYDVAFTLVRRARDGENVTKPHRGHLYQIAHRSGMSATAVALIHWGFAICGGLCCLLFVEQPRAMKPVVALLPLLPQLVWTLYVTRRARAAGLVRWG